MYVAIQRSILRQFDRAEEKEGKGGREFSVKGERKAEVRDFVEWGR